MFGMEWMAPIDRPVTISEDAIQVAQHFTRWRNALLEGAIREAILWRQPSERFVFTNQANRRSTSLSAVIILFVDACVSARTAGVGIGAPEDLRIIERIYAGDESGGFYTVGSRAATNPTVIRKQQGEVWIRMTALLRQNKISVEKPRHAAGYEVDAEIVNGKRELLVETKSGASAADIYSGMGQLLIYRKLLPRLASHRPVLLLPSLPSDPLATAIRDCGVALCTYTLSDVADAVSVAFSPEFLRLCGLRKASRT